MIDEKLEEAKLWIEAGFSKKKTLEILEVHRSLYYYHQSTEMKATDASKRGRPTPGFSVNQSGKRVPDEQIEEFLMEAVEGEESVYGYRKLTNYLRVQHHLSISPKKVYRLCDKLDILLPKRKGNSPYPKRLAKQHVITEPNQLWQVDIKYGSIAESGRFFFLASAIDVFARYIVGHYQGSTCQATDIIGMLQGALIRRQVHFPINEEQSRIIIRTDNGPQFLSRAFGEFCHHHRIYHERIPPKSPNLNAYIESFHSIIERECYQQHVFECFDEAYYRIDEFIEFYNNRRYHGSLKYLSPKEFNHKFKEIGNRKEMVINL
ncbi:IS3 family transposase [Metabacillus litoralis]|uniref:IS3 family transposase n=1 Tax=Metabacillus litoralis TaxID=152268 RepID=UPI0020418F9D|nr:IS3 family transposase [Metabacillus litoralis]MCM3651185.1 IS3 family transposase [Metabacillus litoralis]